MAVSVAVQSFNIGTGAPGSTVVLTGFGFSPKALIFSWSGRTESTDAGGGATSIRGMGFAVSASSFYALCTRDLDGAGTMDTDQGARTDACILEISGSAAVGWADVQSIDADGVTLEILDQFTTDLRVTCIAYGGSDITDAEIGILTIPGATGQQDITNTGGFQPDVSFFLRTDASSHPHFAGTARLCFGAAVDATDQYVIADRAQSGSPSAATNSYCRKGECVVSITNTDTVGIRGSFVSHNSDGFSIDWTELVAGGSLVAWLSIKGGLWKLGDLLTQTDTTTAIQETGFGFSPKGLLFVSHGRGANTADVTDSNFPTLWSIGAASSSSNRMVQAVGSRDAIGSAMVQTFIEYDAVYARINTTTDAIEGLMDLQSIDADGFTAIMDDADPAQSFVWYVAVGDAANNSFSITGSGGLSFGGASTITRGRAVAAAGGLQFGGAGTVKRGRAQSVAGGLVFGGATTPLRGRAVTGDGGLQFSGAAAIVKTGHVLGAGGVQFTGTAPITKQGHTIGAGGFAFAGAATVKRGHVELATGALLFGGTGNPVGSGTGSFSIIGSGSLLLGGAAAIARGRIQPTSGGATFGGSAPVVCGRAFLASGGLGFSGTTAPLRGRVVHGAGGISWASSGIVVRGQVLPATGALVWSGAATIMFGGVVSPGPVEGFFVRNLRLTPASRWFALTLTTPTVRNLRLEQPSHVASIDLTESEP